MGPPGEAHPRVLLGRSRISGAPLQWVSSGQAPFTALGGLTTSNLALVTEYAPELDPVEDLVRLRLDEQGMWLTPAEMKAFPEGMHAEHEQLLRGRRASVRCLPMAG